jgi:hypothetical protein
VEEQRGSVIGRIRHGIDRRLEEWRRQDQARNAEAEADRDKLWTEVKERQKLLAKAIGEEEARRASLGEVTEQRLFVVHSEEASEALGALARERHRLVRVVPGGGSTGAGLKGSWLVFEASE